MPVTKLIVSRSAFFFSPVFNSLITFTNWFPALSGQTLSEPDRATKSGTAGSDQPLQHRYCSDAIGYKNYPSWATDQRERPGKTSQQPL